MNLVRCLFGVLSEWERMRLRALVRPNLYWEDRVNQLNKKENKNMLVQKDYKFGFAQDHRIYTEMNASHT